MTIGNCSFYQHCILIPSSQGTKIYPGTVQRAQSLLEQLFGWVKMPLQQLNQNIMILLWPCLMSYVQHHTHAPASVPCWSQYSLLHLWWSLSSSFRKLKTTQVPILKLMSEVSPQSSFILFIHFRGQGSLSCKVKPSGNVLSKNVWGKSQGRGVCLGEPRKDSEINKAAVVELPVNISVTGSNKCQNSDTQNLSIKNDLKNLRRDEFAEWGGEAGWDNRPAKELGTKGHALTPSSAGYQSGQRSLFH